MRRALLRDPVQKVQMTVLLRVLNRDNGSRWRVPTNEGQQHEVEVIFRAEIPNTSTKLGSTR